MSAQYAKQTFQEEVIYSTLVPLLNINDGKYWWVKQMSMGYGFDANNIMVSHFNIYRLMCEYKGSLANKPHIRPLNAIEEDAEKMVVSLARQQIISDICANLNESQRDVFFTFWELYQQDITTFPSAKKVAQIVESTARTVQTYTTEIRDAAKKQLYIDSDNIKELISFLHSLLGDIEPTDRTLR